MMITVPASPLMRGIEFAKHARRKLVRTLFPEIIRQDERIRLLKKQLREMERQRSTDQQYWYYRGLPQDRYERELCIWYQKVTGKTLNLRDPVTFNEKIQWLKLYDSTPVKSRLADKYAVREWIREQGEEQILVPLIGVYDHFDEIEYDTLPRQFVIKTTHGCGWNVIVEDKEQLDWQKTGEQVEEWLKLDFAFRNGFELHYSNIRPRIVIEQYRKELAEIRISYRFFCFDGMPRFLFVDNGAYQWRCMLDVNWNRLDYAHSSNPVYDTPEKPTEYAEMLRLAGKLSKGFSFVRVDLYPGEKHPLFSELTFTPASGTIDWNDEEGDMFCGNLLRLPLPQKFLLVSQDILEHAEPNCDDQARRQRLPASYRKSGHHRYTGRRHVRASGRYGKKSG